MADETKLGLVCMWCHVWEEDTSCAAAPNGHHMFVDADTMESRAPSPKGREELLPDFLEDVLDMAANGVFHSETDGPKIDRAEKWIRSRLRTHSPEEPVGYVVLTWSQDGEEFCTNPRAFQSKQAALEYAHEADVRFGRTVHPIGQPLGPEDKNDG